MLMKINRLWRGGEKGQGMTEYIIIVCLIAIVALAVVTLFGRNIRGLFTAANDSIATGKVQDPKNLEQDAGSADNVDLTNLDGQ